MDKNDVIEHSATIGAAQPTRTLDRGEFRTVGCFTAWKLTLFQREATKADCRVLSPEP